MIPMRLGPSISRTAEDTICCEAVRSAILAVSGRYTHRIHTGDEQYTYCAGGRWSSDQRI